MSLELLCMESANVVRLSGVKDVRGELVTTATITCTLYDSAGSAVSGASSLAMAHVTAESGTYEATIPAVALTAGALYTIKAVAASPKRTWQLSARATFAN